MRTLEGVRGPEVRLLTLRDLARILGRRWSLLLSITVFGVLLVSALVLRMPNYYDASARVEINPEGPGAEAGTGSVDPAYMNTEIQLITSPGLLANVILDLNLEHDPAFLHHMTKGGRLLRRLLLLDFFARVNKEDFADRDVSAESQKVDAARARELEPFIHDLRARITIRPVQETRSVFRETRLVDVSVRHQSPALAAKLANAIVAQLVRGNEEQTTEGDKIRLGNLMRRAVELQQDVRRSEAQLAAYADAHEIVALDANQNTNLDRLTSLSRDLLEAQNQLRLAEADYASATQPDAAAALAADEVRASLVETSDKLADLGARRAQLLVTATPKWPEVREVQRQIDVLEQHVADLRKQGESDAVAHARAKVTEARVREQAQRTAFEQQRSAVQAQSGASVMYRLMQQEVETKKKILNGLLETVGTKEAGKATKANNLRVVDFAALPNPAKPMGPYRSEYISLAAVISLAIGFAGALLMGHLDDRIWTDDDVRDALAVRSLGGISAAGRGPWSFMPLRARDGRSLITDTRNSLMADDYLRLRTSVLRAAARVPQSLLVTSSVESEGKTTTAANIAISLARMGAKVVVVDADLHRPRQHTLFRGEDGSAGLSSILTGETPMAGAEILLHNDAATGVHVLPAGGPIEDVAERLGKDVMRQLLAILGRRFEYVIVDAPAVQSRVDALLLASAVEGVVMVVQSGRSRRDLVRRSCREIEEAGGTLLGIIVNKAQGVVRRKYADAPAGTAARSASA